MIETILVSGFFKDCLVCNIICVIVECLPNACRENFFSQILFMNGHVSVLPSWDSVHISENLQSASWRIK